MKHYSAQRILSYNAFLNFIVGIRNTGKTWAFKMRAWLRFKRRGSKTVWVRRTEKEVKEICAAGAFYTKNLRRLLNMSDDVFKWDGRRGWCKVKGQWIWFIEVVTVLNASKGADDPDVDTIVYDEFTATKRKLSHYHGNEVEDFLNLVITKKRNNNKFRVFFLGNDETFTNPYYTYLSIPTPERSFVGIRSFKHNSIAVEIISPALAPQYEEKVINALSGTRILDYLTTNTTLDTPISSKILKAPKNAKLLCQVDFCVPCSIWLFKNNIYVKSSYDRSMIIYANRPINYARYQIIRYQERIFFDVISERYKNGNLFYEDGKAFESFTPFLKYLNLI